jgi:hypothetical protein
MYRMRTDSDCGPAALAELVGLPYERVMAKWPGGWLNNAMGGRLAPNDTPYDHFVLLNRVGMPFRIVTLGMILNGECANNKTAILIHNLKKPILSQHWVILAGVSGDVSLHMGDGTVKGFSPALFSDLYSKGWPACAYEIGKGGYKVSWWQRLVAKITGRWV